MKMLIILLAFGMVSYSSNKTRLFIKERISAIKVTHGLYVSQDDSTLLYQGEKYLIQSKEYYDENGEITCAIVKEDIDYAKYLRKGLYKMKGVLAGYGLSKHIVAFLIDKNHIEVNDKKFGIIQNDTKSKILFYKGTTRDVIFQVIYK